MLRHVKSQPPPGLAGAIHSAEKAAEAFNHVLEVKPKSALAHMHLGDAFASAGKHDKAQEEYNKALNLNPKFNSSYLTARFKLNGRTAGRFFCFFVFVFFSHSFN